MAKILIVDDEREIADLVGVYLANDGYAVHKCGTAAEALAVIDAGADHIGVVPWQERQGGVSSIRALSSVYYMVKVSLSLVIYRLSRSRKGGKR